MASITKTKNQWLLPAAGIFSHIYTSIIARYGRFSQIRSFILAINFSSVSCKVFYCMICADGLHFSAFCFLLLLLFCAHYIECNLTTSCVFNFKKITLQMILKLFFKRQIFITPYIIIMIYPLFVQRILNSLVNSFFAIAFVIPLYT